MTSITKLIQIQSDLKEHAKGEYNFRNTHNGTRIITKEIADYSAIKSYMKNNNLQYFTLCPDSEQPIEAVLRHLSPDTSAEEICNSSEDLDFNVINLRQLTINRKTPHGQA